MEYMGRNVGSLSISRRMVVSYISSNGYEGILPHFIIVIKSEVWIYAIQSSLWNNGMRCMSCHRLMATDVRINVTSPDQHQQRNKIDYSGS